MNLSVLTTTGAAAGGNMSSMLIMLLVYGAIIAAMYFIFFRPQNKKKKKEAEMRKNAQVGDEITTIGGICGRPGSRRSGRSVDRPACISH